MNENIQRWIDELNHRKGGKGIKSSLYYYRALNTFLEYFDITPEIFETAAESYTRQFLSEHSEGSARYLKAIKSYCDFRNIKLPKSLTQIAINADYSLIDLTEDQIAAIGKMLSPEFKFIFYLVLSTGCRRSALMHPMEILETKIINDKTIMVIMQYEEKTDRFYKKYIADTYVMQEWNHYAEQLKIGFAEFTINEFQGTLLNTYTIIGVSPEYFYLHPIHALRHVAAHRLLRKYNYNYVQVAKMLGWESPDTLRKFYGAVSDQELEGML